MITWDWNMWPFSRTGKKKKSGRCFVCLKADGVGVVYSPTADQPCRIITQFLSNAPLAQSSELRHFIDSNDLEGVETVGVITGDAYRLLQLEKPTVPDNEIADASRWLIKDLIDFPLDDVALDVFYAPPRTNQQEKVNIVATRLSYLRDFAVLLSSIGLATKQINIAQLAINDLLMQMPEAKKGAVFLYVEADCFRLVISCKGQMYLERKLVFHPGQLLSDDADSERLDAFLLEVQRSLDFYQTQYGQSPPAKLYLDPLFQEQKVTAPKIMAGFSIPTEIFDLNALLKLPESVDSKLQSYCLPAIGAAFGKKLEELLT